MNAQHGLFLCQLNLKATFMENLTKGLAMTGNKEPVMRLADKKELEAAAHDDRPLKIRIAASEHRRLLAHLREINITEATLFPGVEGFFRSLNYLAVGV